MSNKYVAYVATYTRKDDHGIHVFDVDMENGRLEERGTVDVANSSYVTISHNKKYLYSITDMGVVAFKILPDGNLEKINQASINGMRGCYLSTDYEDKYLFCAGYHDGKITVLRLDPQTGAVGQVTDEVFHKGLGSVAERSFRPHISCVKMTRDNKYLCAADLGIDYVNIYRLDHNRGTLKQVDIIRCELESAPRHIQFSKDGRFMYVVCELKNYVDVYSYREENDLPFFDHIQTIDTSEKTSEQGVAACALTISEDGRYLVASNAGENTVTLFEANEKTGKLTRILCLPISGDYPKDSALFPDNKHLVCLNHESGAMTFFTLDTKKKTLVMNGKEIAIKYANCIAFRELA